MGLIMCVFMLKRNCKAPDSDSVPITAKQQRQMCLQYALQYIKAHRALNVTLLIVLHCVNVHRAMIHPLTKTFN